MVNTHTYKGLPDAHDFSRYKDFYSFHLWNYCSGNVENGTYKVNFCSQTRQPLYDLFGFWKVWGASVKRPGVRFSWLDRGPKLLHIFYIVTACVKGLELLASTPSLFTERTNTVTLVLSTVSIIILFSTWTNCGIMRIGSDSCIHDNVNSISGHIRPTHQPSG